jgi:phage shock protein C
MASYCAACGASLPAGSRFCSGCGRANTEPGYSSPVRQLQRPLAGRKIAGVCQGLANQYGWDVTVSRIIFVVLAVMLFPLGLLLYGLLWLIAPEEPRLLPPTTHLDTAN